MFLVGVLLGGLLTSVVAAIIFARLRLGVLQVDHSDLSEPPMLLLLLSKKDASKVETRKYVILKVKHEDLISQK